MPSNFSQFFNNPNVMQGMMIDGTDATQMSESDLQRNGYRRYYPYPRQYPYFFYIVPLNFNCVTKDSRRGHYDTLTNQDGTTENLCVPGSGSRQQLYRGGDQPYQQPVFSPQEYRFYEYSPYYRNRFFIG